MYDEHDIKDLIGKKLRVGAYFGEISLCYNCASSATVVARKYCNLAALTPSDFDGLMIKMPDLAETLK